MNLTQVPQEHSQYLVPTYSPSPPVFTHGEGSRLYDADGNQYLDFCAGIAVTALGHNDPEWVAALVIQAHKLTHVSNLFHTAPHIALAKKLVTCSFAERVFFSNSGAEANEAALKFARKWASTNFDHAKTQILAFEGSFHGRTLGALSLTFKAEYRDPFAPLIPGVTFAPMNDIQAARHAISDATCAVFIEPIQGEGGVQPASESFLAALRSICNQNNALLVFDEVQCGLGRTGYLWAHQAYGVTPDIMTIAKPLAGGLPVGATLVREDVARAISVGDHGSTFAGNPLVCRAAQIVLERVSQKEFLHGVQRKGQALMEALGSLPSEHILELRGSGLMIGIEFDIPVKPLIEAALAMGLVVINAGERVLRICPPLTISEGEIAEGAGILSQALSALQEPAEP